MMPPAAKRPTRSVGPLADGLVQRKNTARVVHVQVLDHPPVDGHHALALGLRRGEGCGQGWDDTHLEAKPPRLDVLRELVVDGYTPIETAPKTDSSVAAVVIDRGTVAVLRAHKKRQKAERKA